MSIQHRLHTVKELGAVLAWLLLLQVDQYRHLLIFSVYFPQSVAR